jgi:hypothetical protein
LIRLLQLDEKNKDREWRLGLLRRHHFPGSVTADFKF